MKTFDLTVPDERAAAVQEELETLRVKAEAKEQFEAERAPTHTPITTLTVAQLYARPTTAYLIDQLIPRGALVELVGASKAMKTFYALDMALTIASSKTVFHSQPVVAHGPVLYIAGEGQMSLPNRVRAWSHHNGIDATTIPFEAIVVPTNFLRTPVRDDLRRIAKAMKPVLIIVDTLHRVIPGGEENSSKELGIVIEFAAQLQVEFGSTVLFLHHPPKSNPAGQGRGSGAMYNAADTEISAVIEPDSEQPDHTKIVKFTVVKQKDDAEVSFTLRNSIVDVVDEQGHKMAHDSGRALTSCVLVEASEADVEAAKRAADDARTKRIIEYVTAHPGCSQDELLKSVGGKSSACRDAIGELVKANRLTLTEKGKRHQYRLAHEDDAIKKCANAPPEF